MLNVVGLTYDHTVNYGSCFQAYALQEAVKKMRIFNDTCDYRLIPIETFEECKKPKTWKSALLYPMLCQVKKQFESFEKKHMQFVSVSSLKELPSLNEETDAFVCGSDVIWNPDFNHGFGAFYLDFAEKYKFSYAASFGKAEIDEETLQAVAEKINALDSISVRDKTSERMAAQCTDKPIRIVADPVVLLDREEWSQVAEHRKDDEKYIFVYATHISESIEEFMRKLQSETGYKIVCSAWGPKQALKLGKLKGQKPEEWLGLLRDAEYVVTNSFHATVFSLVFHRKVFVVVNGEKDKGINVRMNDLLSYVGLPNRIFSEVPETIDLGEIDYSEADGKLKVLREESLAFLRSNLENAYSQKQKAEAK